MTVAMLEESAKQEKIRRNLMVQTRRMQQALTDPIEIKMRSDRVLDQAVSKALVTLLKNHLPFFKIPTPGSHWWHFLAGF